MVMTDIKFTTKIAQWLMQSLSNAPLPFQLYCSFRNHRALTYRSLATKYRPNFALLLCKNKRRMSEMAEAEFQVQLWIKSLIYFLVRDRCGGWDIKHILYQILEKSNIQRLSYIVIYKNWRLGDRPLPWILW